MEVLLRFDDMAMPDARAARGQTSESLSIQLNSLALRRARRAPCTQRPVTSSAALVTRGGESVPSHKSTMLDPALAALAVTVAHFIALFPCIPFVRAPFCTNSRDSQETIRA